MPDTVINDELTKILLEYPYKLTGAEKKLVKEQYERELEQWGERQREFTEKNVELQEYGRADVTLAGLKAIKENLDAVKKGIEDYLKGREHTRGTKPPAFEVLSRGEPETLAFIILGATVRGALQKYTHKRKKKAPKKKDKAVQTLAIEIAKELEKHRIRWLGLACQAWHDAEKARKILDETGLTYDDKYDNQKSRPEVAIEKKARREFARLLKKLNIDTAESPKDIVAEKLGKKWNNLVRDERSEEERDKEYLRCGTACIDIILDNTKLILCPERKKPTDMYRIKPTEELKKYTDVFNGVFRPYPSPMLCRPKPWNGDYGGGYLLNDKETAVIKERHPDQLKDLEYSGMQEVFDALNAIQNVPWKINEDVLRTVQELWDTAKAKKRKDEDFSLFRKDGKKKLTKEERISLIAQIELYLEDAKRLSGRRFYLPANFDFRGRLYYLPYLNPQGGDIARALLDFAETVPIDRGVSSRDEADFLSYGQRLFNEQKYFHTRAKWYKGNKENILDAASSPIKNTWWMQGKEKWQFLKWCFEVRKYTEIIEKNPENLYRTLKTGMPIYIDATSSGLQIFAALMRDEVMAAKTNLSMYSDKIDLSLYGTPRDIYQTVLNTLESKLTNLSKQEGEEADLAKKWLGRINRKTIKSIVMTIPYQKKRNTHIKGLSKQFDESYKSAEWIFNKIQQAIKVEMPRIDEIPDWLKKVCKEFNKYNKHLEWPMWGGFVVRQRYLKNEACRIEDVQYRGKPCKLTIQKRTDVLDTKDSMQAVVANFIHSIDAAQLIATVNQLIENGKHNLATAHDCFACPMGDLWLMAECALNGFVKIHKKTCLSDYQGFFEEQLGLKLPDSPKEGEFDINAVNKSVYAFS